MPMTTMFDSSRGEPSFGLGHSPYWSRIAMNWPTISAAPRFRTSFCVPVWQKRQESVQPTWVEMQTAPRSSARSGM